MSAPVERTHAEAQESRFIANAGTSLATWGLGACLLLLRHVAPAQAKALPIILIPVAVAALAFALSSSNQRKREDASHIHLLALAGSMAPFGLVSAYYYGIGISLIALNIFNVRGLVQLAPFGPTAIFVALLSPVTTNLPAVTFLCLTNLACTVLIGRHERHVATSVFPLLASLYMLARVDPERQVTLGVLALLHVAVLYLLRFGRDRRSVPTTERRILLDEVVVAYALSQALLALTPLEEAHMRYALVGTLFLGAASLRGSWRPIIPHRAAVVTDWIGSNNELRARASTVTGGLCLVAAVVAWPLAIERTGEVALRAASIMLVAAALHWQGRKTDSFVQRDAAKLLLAFASLRAYSGISGPIVIDSTSLSLALLASTQYAAIALTVYAAGVDLGKKGQGAWQGVFSGRALAMIRRTRSRVFDVISQAPLVGWMFHLGDKAAVNLQGTFGTSKTWTIAHYVICLTIAMGAISTTVLATELLVHRMPHLASALISLSDAEKTASLRTSLARLLAILAYATTVFAAGAFLFKSYLRALALILACFLLAIEAFGALSDKVAISIFFYPLALCGLMALFRIVYRSHRSSGD